MKFTAKKAKVEKNQRMERIRVEGEREEENKAFINISKVIY